MIDRDIKKFVLKALLAAGNMPMAEDAVRRAVKTGFAHAALTHGDIGQWIGDRETAGLIAGTVDAVSGTMWALTTLGKISAQQLPR